MNSNKKYEFKNINRNDLLTPDPLAFVFYNDTLDFVICDYSKNTLAFVLGNNSPLELELYNNKALILYKELEETKGKFSKANKALIVYKDENKALVFYFRLNKT